MKSKYLLATLAILSFQLSPYSAHAINIACTTSAEAAFNKCVLNGAPSANCYFGLCVALEICLNATPTEAWNWCSPDLAPDAPNYPHRYKHEWDINGADSGGLGDDDLFDEPKRYR